MPVYDKILRTEPQYGGELFHFADTLNHPTLGPISIGDEIKLPDWEGLYIVFEIYARTRGGTLDRYGNDLLDNIDVWVVQVMHPLSHGISNHKPDQIEKVFRPTLKEADQMMPPGDDAAASAPMVNFGPNAYYQNSELFEGRIKPGDRVKILSTGEFGTVDRIVMHKGAQAIITVERTYQTEAGYTRPVVYLTEVLDIVPAPYPAPVFQGESDGYDMPHGDSAASFKLKNPFKRDKKRTKQQVQFDIDNIEEFLKNQPDLDREMVTEKRRQLFDLKQELLTAKARLYLENTQGDIEAAAHLMAAESSNLL